MAPGGGNTPSAAVTVLAQNHGASCIRPNERQETMALGCKARRMQGSAINRTRRIARRIAAVVVLVPAIGACSADIGLNNVTFTPNPEPARSKPDWATFSGSKSEFTLRPVAQTDLVGPEGQCAGGPGQVAPAPGEPVLPPSTPTVQGGIALQMTECDVVTPRWRHRQGRYRRQRTRRAGRDADLQPRAVARRLPVHRWAADLDRAAQRPAGRGQRPKIHARA